MCMARAIPQALFCVGACDAFLIHCYVDVLKGFLSFSVISFRFFPSIFGNRGSLSIFLWVFVSLAIVYAGHMLRCDFTAFLCMFSDHLF